MNNNYQLKRGFYKNHFDAYFNFLNKLSLNPDFNRTAMTIVINEINNRCNFVLFKAPFFIPNSVFSVEDPQEAASSVEEFFNILQTNEKALDDVSKMLNFLSDPSGIGTHEEMDNLSEDRVLRAICFYFWDKKGRSALKANNKQLKWIETREKNSKEKWDKGDYDYEKYEQKDYAQVINGPLRSLLGNEFDDFSKFINLARMIRNQVTHGGSFFNQAEGYQIYRFILFIYMTSVLMIRRAQFQGEPYEEFPAIRLFLDQSYHSVKLFDGQNESPLPCHSTEDGRCYYQVQWYKTYRLEIDGQSTDFSLTCNDWEPSASKSSKDIRIFRNDSQVNNDARSVSFHQAMDAFEATLVEVRAIKENTKSIPQIFEVLKSRTQNKSQDEITQFLRQILQELQSTAQGNRGPKLDQLLDAQNQVLSEIHRNNKKRADFSERLLLGVLILCLVLAVIICVSNGMNDFSLEWLTHRWVHIIPIAVVAVACGIGFYLSKRWKTNVTKWKRWIPAAMAGMTCVLIGVAYLLIPALTYKSFVSKYDFAKHDSGTNAAAVVFMKGYKDQSDEATLMQLATYYYRYTDSLPEAQKYALTLSDVKRYPNGCTVAAEVLLAARDPELNSLIKRYNNLYGKSHRVLDRIEGLQGLFGLGKERNDSTMNSGIKKLRKAAADGDTDACYYLGYVLSHDLTDWHEGEAEYKVLPWLAIHLPLAAKYFGEASSMGHPRASLQLGKIYADLNMSDSAIYYYSRAIEQCRERKGQIDSKRLRQAALFQMGLVCESTGDTISDFIGQARREGYEPAMLYTALKEKDHVTAISIFKKMGEYKGYRYIPPIVFEYVAVGDSVSALNTLKKARPDGNFNKEFVSAMQRIVGSDFVRPDFDQALNMMRLSAKKGCKFAQLWCIYMEGYRENLGNSELQSACAEIAFGRVIWSLNFARQGKYFDAFESAAKAVSAGQPAGAVAFISMNHNQKQDVMPDSDFMCWRYGVAQQAARMVSNHHVVDTLPSFKQTALLLAIAFYEAYCNKIAYNDPNDIKFWREVASANQLSIADNYIHSAGKVGISPEDVLFEFSNFLDAYYESALNEDEMAIPGMQSNHYNGRVDKW